MVIQVNLRDKKDASIIQAILQADAAGIPRSVLVRQWYESSTNEVPHWAKQILRQQQEILEKLNNGISLNGKEEAKEGEKVDLGGLWDED